MLKEKASLLQKHGKHLFGKSSGTTLPTPSNPRKKSKKYLQNTKSPFHLAPHTQRDKVRGKSFCSQKTGSKKFHNSNQKKNNSNVIPFTDRQGVSNRDMVGIIAPQQTFFSMDLNPGKRIYWESRKVHPLNIKIILV